MARPPVRGDRLRQNDDEEALVDDDTFLDDPPGTEYEELRPQSTRARRVVTVLVALFAVGILVVGGAVLWLRTQLDPSGPPGAEVRVTVPTGSSNTAIAELLDNAGVVPSAQAFRYYLRFKGAEGFLAGEFVFHENSSAWDALRVLDDGPLPPAFRQFTIPEGFTIAQLAAKISTDVPGFSAEVVAEKLASGQVPRSIFLPPEVIGYEGFLFPDTYRVEEGQDELSALSAMATQFDAVANEVGLAQSEDLVGLTPYEVVIVASLIQEEAGRPEEMPQIARVIYNRLDEGMPLGIDAALCYGLNKSCAELTRSDLESDNPYNTRINTDLPPTPIASPGREALAAALHPVDGPWLYYVRDPDASRTPPGGHFFTDDYEEFLAVKRDCEAAGLGCG